MVSILVVQAHTLSGPAFVTVMTTCLPPCSFWFPRAWIEEGQPEAPALPMLPELPEVPVEMPPGPELLSSEAVLRYQGGLPLGVGLGCYLS